MMKKRDKRGDIAWDKIGYAILALVLLAVVFVGIFILQGRGAELIASIEDIFRSGRA